VVNKEVDGDKLALTDGLYEFEDVVDRVPLGVLSLECVKCETVWIPEILDVTLTGSV